MLAWTRSRQHTAYAVVRLRSNARARCFLNSVSSWSHPALTRLDREPIGSRFGRPLFARPERTWPDRGRVMHNPPGNRNRPRATPPCGQNATCNREAKCGTAGIGRSRSPSHSESRLTAKRPRARVACGRNRAYLKPCRCTTYHSARHEMSEVSSSSRFRPEGSVKRRRARSTRK